MANDARSFNGTSDHIIASSFSSISYTSFSISFWVYVNSTTVGNSRCVNNSHTDSDKNGFQVYISAGTPTVNIWVGNGTTFAQSISSTISYNTWIHVIGIYDGSHVSLYINGVLQGSPPALTGSMTASSYSLIMGEAVYSSDFLKGSLADIAIWNTALNSTEISSLASGQRANTIGANANLKAYWPITGASPEPDQTGDGYDGTIVGTTVVSGPSVFNVVAVTTNIFEMLYWT